MVQDNIGIDEILDEGPNSGSNNGKSGGSPMKLVIMIVAILVVLGGLGFGAFYVMVLMPASAPDYVPIEVVYSGTGLTTNISEYEDVYVRFQYSLIFEVNEETKAEEFAAKTTYVSSYEHLIKAATITAVREKTRRELIDPDAPIDLCDSILEYVNAEFASVAPTGKEYGVRSGIGALIGKDTDETKAKRATYERLSAPENINFTKCYHTDYIIQ